MDRHLYFSARDAELKRAAAQHAAEAWRLANPGHRRRRWQWHLPQLGHLVDRAVTWAAALRTRPAKPGEQCC